MKSSRKLWKTDFSREGEEKGIVAGIDEAGRGPLAGPVVAAAVHIPAGVRDHPVWAGVRDSKTLSSGRRGVLFPVIKQISFWGMGQASPAEIDAMNILEATLLAMERACHDMTERFSITPHLVLVDGNRLPRALPCRGEALIGGGGLSVSIAAASILAKVARDREMAALHAAFPVYGWDRNAGYGTREHLNALEKHGPSPHHRASFRVKEKRTA